MGTAHRIVCKEYLARYGVEDFATPDEVYHKIIASDGSVTYVANIMILSSTGGS